MPNSAWTPPTIRTERLVIRPFTASDLNAFEMYASSHAAAEYGSWLGGAGPEDAARYLVDTIARYGRPPRCDLGVVLDGRLVGGVAFRGVWMAPPTMEIGWVLDPTHGGRGLAREAVQALIASIFDRFPDTARVEARVRVKDTSGIRLLEKLGFVHEGTIRSETDTGAALLYGVLRGEWQA